MRLRAGVVRALIAVLALVVLVLPVGSEPDAGEIYSIPRAVGELARGNVGTSVLGAVVAGGDFVAGALVRMLIVATLWAAYVLAGMAFAQRPMRPPREPTRTCPNCGFRTARSMADCPSCGAGLNP